MLEAIDQLWQEHLYTMDQLRSSIYLRTYAQKDPLVEYKNEAFTIFDMMMHAVRRKVAENMFRATVTTLSDFEQMLAALPRQFSADELPPGLLEALQSQSITVNGVPPETTGNPADMLLNGAVPPAEPVRLQPVTRSLPKVGPNDPCPCGSGRKYKKCCGK